MGQLNTLAYGAYGTSIFVTLIYGKRLGGGKQIGININK